MSLKTDIQNNISVLVIEDNQGDFTLIEDFLIEKFKNIIINHCLDYKTAVEFLLSDKSVYNVILLDLHLNDMNGLELIENLLSHSSKVPIIILTGYTDLPLAKKSLQLGIYDFLVKDEINPNLLHKSIEFAISRNDFISQIEIQNEKLKNIAWTQSHIVRAPLARMLGIMNVIENNEESIDDILLLLKHLRDSANEMDSVVKKIVDEAQHLK